jgi:type I restriction enzyme S subunit
MVDLVGDVTSGIWGEEAVRAGLLKSAVVRGADFPRVAVGSLIGVPTRYLAAESIVKHKLAAGDLLIEISGGSDDQPTGRVVLVRPELVASPQPVAFSNFLKRVRVDPKLVRSDFFLYLWQYLYVQGRTRIYEQRTTGLRNFKLSDFLEKEVVTIPSLEAQDRIASILRKVDIAREATAHVASSTRLLRASALQHLLSVGAVGELEASVVAMQDTSLGPAPAHWRVVDLADLIQIKQGQVDPRLEPYRNMLHVGPENIEPGLGRIARARRAGDLGLVSGKYLFGPMDVLYSKIRPYLRKAATPDFEGVCSADMYPLRPKTDRITRDYLYYYLLSEGFTAQAISLQDRTGIPKLNRHQLLSLKAPLPPIAEQNQITSILRAIDRKLDVEDASLAALGRLSSTLLRDLIGSSMPPAAVERPNG